MGRKSIIYEFLEDLLKKINKLLLSKKATLNQLKELITEYELKNGIDIQFSNCSLGRYKKSFDKATKDLQAIEYLVNSLPESSNFNTENKIHRFIVTMLNKAMYEVPTTQSLNPKEIAEIAQATKNIMTSIKDREKIRNELEKEIKEEQLVKLDRAGEDLGISKSKLVALHKIMSGE